MIRKHRPQFATLFRGSLAYLARVKRHHAPERYDLPGSTSEPVRAVEVLRQAVRLEPNNPDAFAELAYSRAYAGGTAEVRAVAHVLRLPRDSRDGY